MKLSASQVKVLSKLIDQYESSTTYMGINKIRQSFGINVERMFPRYQDDSEYDFFVSFNEEMKELADLGWVELSEKHRRLSRIILVRDALSDIYKALGRTPRKEMQSDMLKLFDDLEQEIADRQRGGLPEQLYELCRVYLGYIGEQRKRIGENKAVTYYSGDMDEYIDVWKVLLSLFDLEGEMFVRDLSVRLFHDSKRLEKLYDKAEGILFEYGEYPEKHHVLEEYGIIKIPSHVCIKGNIELYFGKEKLSLHGIAGDIGLSAGALADVSDIIISGSRVVTIENLTSFYRYDCGQDDAAIYLAGYHSRQKREFLQMIYRKYPYLEYFHFGDIDAGGFYIYEHLRRKTGIPFRTMKMDSDTLLFYEEYAKKLTSNDRKRVGKLIEYYNNTPVSDDRTQAVLDTLRLMLEKNIKLEQEAL